MAAQYQLPTLDDLTRLAEPHELAITIYVATSPIVSERTTSQITAKSAFDACIEKVREAGDEALDRDRAAASSGSRW